MVATSPHRTAPPLHGCRLTEKPPQIGLLLAAVGDVKLPFRGALLATFGPLFNHGSAEQGCVQDLLSRNWDETLVVRLYRSKRQDRDLWRVQTIRLDMRNLEIGLLFAISVGGTTVTFKNLWQRCRLQLTTNDALWPPVDKNKFTTNEEMTSIGNETNAASPHTETRQSSVQCYHARQQNTTSSQ